MRAWEWDCNGKGGCESRNETAVVKTGDRESGNETRSWSNCQSSRSPSSSIFMRKFWWLRRSLLKHLLEVLGIISVTIPASIV